jgi:hypothetical protein
VLCAEETLPACGSDGDGCGQLVVGAGSTETHAGGSNGTGPVSAVPAAGSAPAANAKTSAMNHLERLLATIDSSFDSCQGEEKAQGNETCGKSLG